MVIINGAANIKMYVWKTICQNSKDREKISQKKKKKKKEEEKKKVGERKKKFDE